MSRTPFPRFGRTIGAAALVVGVTAGTAQSDIFRAVGRSGSEALVTHVLSLPGMPARAAGDLRIFEARRGYRAAPGIQGDRDFRIRPVLSFEPNVNGGVPKDRIEVAGLTFLIDQEAVARPGVMIGIEAIGHMRQNLAPGFALDLGIRGQVVASPQHQVTRTSLDASACLRAQLSTRSYAHACAQVRYRENALSRQFISEVTAGMTRAFGDGTAGLHAVTGEVGMRRVQRRGAETWTQGFVRISTASALRSGTAITTSLEIGQQIPGVHAQRLSASVGFIQDIAGQPTSFNLFYGVSEGGMFLGAPRRDTTVGLSVSRPISDRMSITASVSRTRSTASLFNGDVAFGLGLQMSF